jgi:hypothetical protein
MSHPAQKYNDEMKANAIKRQTASAKRILAEYKLANDAWGGGNLPSSCPEIEDWYESSKEAFWGIANWVTKYGTDEQKAFVADEAMDFDKYWHEEYNKYTKTTEGYWRDM